MRASNATNEAILKMLKKERILTVTALSKKAGKHYYSTLDAVKFLQNLGIIEVITSGTTSLVRLKNE